jgi:HD-GYP domain-containing protein (c-di-GMP phosphodiesterase class II)
MLTPKENLKRISVDDLKMGMFIVNLGRSWLAHPFLRNQFSITSPKQIKKLKKYGIREVYIDPRRGFDVPLPKIELKASYPPPVGKLKAPEGARLPEKAQLNNEQIDLSGGPSLSPMKGEPPLNGAGPEVSFKPPEKSDSMAYWQENVRKVEESLPSHDAPFRIPYDDDVPYANEIESARAIQWEAQNVVRQVMNDVRMGRSIESERVKRVVNSIVDSILRNQDALVSLTRMKSLDEYTFVHSLDVCILSLSLARHLNLSREEMMEVGIGALLHDVGKMKLPTQVLKKPDTLSENEWVEVRKHPVYSLEIMEASQGISEPSKQLALQHHERYNGCGYPFGLKGDTIGTYGQIVGIIDFYDAVTTDRPYQKAIQPHEAIRQIYERGQGEFNRLMVERFIQCIGIYPFGTLVLMDTEEMGIVCGVRPEILLRPNVLAIYQNSRTPYPEPFLADLTEKADHSSWYKRSIIMPLDPSKWNIRVEDYLGDLKRTLREQLTSVPAIF